jgi:hypothetical protein
VKAGIARVIDSSAGTGDDKIELLNSVPRKVMPDIREISAKNNDAGCACKMLCEISRLTFSDYKNKIIINRLKGCIGCILFYTPW